MHRHSASADHRLCIAASGWYVRTLSFKQLLSAYSPCFLDQISEFKHPDKLRLQYFCELVSQTSQRQIFGNARKMRFLHSRSFFKESKEYIFAITDFSLLQRIQMTRASPDAAQSVLTAVLHAQVEACLHTASRETQAMAVVQLLWDLSRRQTASSPASSIPWASHEHNHALTYRAP